MISYMWSPDPTCHTIAIIGAGFSGTALAYRLLKAADWNGRVILIEGTGRFGPGLAYGVQSHKAVLNVPAANMSIDERRPTDFVEYLVSVDQGARAHDFASRRVYGQYLTERLRQIASAEPSRARLVRVSGVALSLHFSSSGGCYCIATDDGRQIAADAVVLATGHAKPASLPALSPLEGAPAYVQDPWSTLPGFGPAARVMIVGTGLTMADVVTELMERPAVPTKIYAVSRHGLLPNERAPSLSACNPEPFELSGALPQRSIVRLLASVRSAVREAQSVGRDWREVMAGLRPQTATLWASLPVSERRRFLRHLQPYWDVHRHLLPPSVAISIRGAIRSGRLEFCAARIVAGRPHKRGARIVMRRRGSHELESLDVDQVINCTGPAADVRLNRSALVQHLLSAGWMTPDPSGCGIHVDAHCRLIDRSGRALPAVYYLGPALRARDWEMTAVPELRRGATALARHLIERASAGSVQPHRARIA